VKANWSQHCGYVTEITRRSMVTDYFVKSWYWH